MPPRLTPVPFAVLTGTLLCISACADAAPEPVVSVPIVLERPTAKPPQRIARLRKPGPACDATPVALSTERKEALFRQFDATVGPAGFVPPLPPVCQAQGQSQATP